jgi:hypothetical protein
VPGAAHYVHVDGLLIAVAGRAGRKAYS